MKIEYLYIKDFKTIQELELDNFSFINLISGKNGNGKSSLIEAIIFLLTNSLNDKIEEYIRWFQKEFIIRMKATHKGSLYDYEIVGDPSGTKRVLKIDGDEYFNSDANKKMAEVIDPTLTLYSAISEQNKGTNILFEKPVPRLEKLKKIFGIEKIQTIIERIKEDISENKLSIEKLSSAINILENLKFKFEDEVDLPSINIKEYKEKLVKLEKDKITYEEEVIENKIYEEKLDNYNNSQNSIDQLKEYKKLNNTNLEKLQLKDLPDYNENEIIDIKDKIAEVTNTILVEKNNKERYEDNVRQFENINKKILIKKSELGKVKRLKRISKPSMSDEEYDRGLLELNELNEERIKLKNIYEAKLKGKCFNCDTEFSSTNVMESKDEYVKVDESFNKLDNTLQEGKEELLSIKETEETNERIKLNKKNIQDQISELENEKATLQIVEEPNFNIDTLEENLNSLNILKTDVLVKKEKYNSIEEENKEISNKRKGYENEIISLNAKLEEHNKVKKPEEFKFSLSFDKMEYNGIQIEIKNYEDIEREQVRIIKYNDGIRKEKKENLSKINNNQEELDNLNKKNVNLNNSKKLLDKEFSSWIISKGIVKVKQKMNDFFTKSYGGKYVVDIKQDKKSVNFFYGKDKDNMKSVNISSGFEQALLAMSFRVALCKIQNIGIMIMDEVDSDSDIDNSLELFKILLEEKENQFFIITHQEETKRLLINNYDANNYYFKEGKLIN